MLYKIIDHLYLTDAPGAKDCPNYHHVNCTKDLPKYNSSNYDFYRVAANDNGYDGAYFVKDLPGAVKFIHDKLSRQEDVIVHCLAGQQRSCAVIAAFLMAHYEYFTRKGSDINEVVSYMRTKKEDAFHKRVNFLGELTLWRDAIQRGDLNSVLQHADALMIDPFA